MSQKRLARPPKPRKERHDQRIVLGPGPIRLEVAEKVDERLRPKIAFRGQAKGLRKGPFKDGLDFLLDVAGPAVRPTILVLADEWLHRALLCSVHVANSIWPARRNRKKKFLFSKNRRQRRGLKPQLSDLI
jgi:hypothetical protein